MPTLSFYVYLSPFDIQSLNVRHFFSGLLPDTSDVLTSPHCPDPDMEVCTAEFLQPELIALELESLTAAHTGQPDPSTAMCAGVDHGDSVARGYMTVDAVDHCAFAPTVATHSREEWESAEGYFAETGTSMHNVLWGDYFFVDPAGNSAQSATPVHIRAAPESFEAGDFTFYGRYVSFDGSDGRVPLSGKHAVRFLNGGPFDGGTDLIVWRDTRSADVAPTTCSQGPAWAPLNQRAIRLFDEDEFPFAPPLGPRFPWAVQRVAVGGDDFPVGVPFGWLELDLWHDVTTPSQAWVTAVMTALGRYSVQHESNRLDDLCNETAVVADDP